MASTVETLAHQAAAQSGAEQMEPTQVPHSRAEPRQRSRRIPSLRRVEREVAQIVYGDVIPIADVLTSVVPRARSEVASRALNVTIAVLACIALAPVFLLIALGVKLTSRGSVFYSQSRVGLDRRRREQSPDCDRRTRDWGGRVFEMYKFRTMRVDAEPDGRAVWAAKQDPRVTPIGRLLRRTRLDELPQLYNVIRGDMNIVGPRPERPSIFDRLRTDVAQYALRQQVRPGITGWAQINQGYDASIDDVRQKVRYDIEYLQSQGLLEDLWIMTLTLPVMLFRRSGW